jgi:hypothetical protein
MRANSVSAHFSREDFFVSGHEELVAHLQVIALEKV